MIIAYSHTIDYPFSQALLLATTTFPTIDFSRISTASMLESALYNAGEVLYVNTDFSGQINAALANDVALAEEVQSKIGVLECPEDGQPMLYTQEDLDAAVFCEVPDEFPDVSVPGDQEITDIEDEIAAADVTAQEEIAKVMSCVDEMRTIANSINTQIDRETRLRTTMTSLEELWFNYRVMNVYFSKRHERLDQILGIFNPLITEQKEINAEISRITPIRNAAYSTFVAISAIVNPNIPGTPTYTQAQYNQWLAAKQDFEYNDAYLTNLNSGLDDVKNRITLQKNNIAPFTDTGVTTTDTATFGSVAEVKRQEILENRISGLISGNSTVYDRISSFSSRTKVNPISGSNPGESFEIEIQHLLTDEDNVLAGRPKTYTQSSSTITLSVPPEGDTPSGILYDTLYNIWGDDQKFFTNDEKGITENASYASSDIKGTGSENYKDKFIGDSEKFKDFYVNFPTRWDAKVAFVKSNVIEPALSNLTQSVEDFAVREVEYMLAYGRAFQALPAEDLQLRNIIGAMRQAGTSYSSRVEELRQDLLFVQDQHRSVLKNIDTERGKYQSVPCALNSASKDPGEPAGAGNDPLGIESLKANDPSKPNPTKWCYWVKFAALATAVNVLPIPGQGGLRYWPIGLTIPNPSGLLKIPLPIVWVPLAVIPLQIGIFVIFLGVCGICPSPVVFYVGPNGEKQFIISLRPGQEFGSSAEKQIIKTLDKLGVAVNTKVTTMLNSINVPSFSPLSDVDGKSTLLDDAKDKIIKNIQKLPKLPDVTALNRLNPSATIQAKRDALTASIIGYMDRVVIPDLKFPKSGDSVNPKPPPVVEILNQLKSAAKMNLPQISVPPLEKINLKTKLQAEVDKIDISSMSFTIKSPPVPGIQQNPAQAAEYIQSVKDAIKSVINKAKAKITPQTLGLVAEIAAEGVTFINPYQCKPTTKGITAPPIPPLVAAALLSMDGLVDSIFGNISPADIVKVLGGQPLYSGNLGRVLKSVIDKMPPMEVPNPSKISIKDMLKDSIKNVVKMQLPSLPDPTKGIQLRVTVPGDLLKGAIKTGVTGTLKAFDVANINFQKISPIDLKQIAISIVEDSFKPVESALDPFLDIVSKFKSAKDKTFPETLGLKKVSPSTDMVPVVTKKAMDTAMDVLKTLSLVPYPAVAIAPAAFKNLHPVLTSDDLPPWERLGLSNFLFVAFLDEWCSQGKKTCGFFENP